MDSEFLAMVLEHYNWLGSLITLACIVAVTVIGKTLLFRLEPLQKMRELNRSEDRIKWKKDKYPPIVRANHRLGLGMNIMFFVLMLPFFVSLQAAPAWKILLDIFIILMFYDFLYYLSHRFWFHGNGRMRQVHAVHHQARNPTYLDAHYVHPLETFVGLALYMGSIAVLSPLIGPYHPVTIILTFVIFTQINIVNHTHVDLDYFPFKTLTWITRKHHVHHENMHKGNYATITLLYDRIFGTLD